MRRRNSCLTDSLAGAMCRGWSRIGRIASWGNVSFGGRSLRLCEGRIPRATAKDGGVRYTDRDENRRDRAADRPRRASSAGSPCPSCHHRDVYDLTLTRLHASSREIRVERRKKNGLCIMSLEFWMEDHGKKESGWI